jgi:hypothetical protein
MILPRRSRRINMASNGPAVVRQVVRIDLLVEGFVAVMHGRAQATLSVVLPDLHTTADRALDICVVADKVGKDVSDIVLKFSYGAI